MRPSVVVTVAALAFATLGGAQARADPITAGLDGYWQFNGNGADSSGNGRDFTLVGNPGFAPGLYGKALDLHDNSSQYAQRPVNDTVFDFGSGDFTIQLWVNFHNVSSSREQTLFEKFQGATGPGWTISMVDRGGTAWEFYSTPTVLLDTAPQNIQPDTWYDLTVRRSGNNFDLFVNDQLLASGTGSGALSATTNPLLAGRRDSQDPRDLAVDGRLDEYAIWQRALTDAELETLYNGGRGTPLSVPESVPEPASLTLLGFGALGMLGYAWRRRRQPG